MLKVDLFFPQINVDQAELCGVTNNFNGAVEVKLAHNAGAVVFNSFWADEESFADFIGGSPSATRVITSCSRGVRVS